MPDQNLKNIFLSHKGRLIDKWEHYFYIYETHFAKYIGKSPKILEIGIYHGGSLQMWKKYFGTGASIVGMDINPECKNYEEEGIKIEIGDQSDSSFWKSFFSKHGDFDIIIDDGSHINLHQIITFINAWPHLKEDGTFLVEDCHTSYWREYSGGYCSPGTFIEFSKRLIDQQNAYWSRDAGSHIVTEMTNQVRSISFHDSVVVFNKYTRHSQSKRVSMGIASRSLNDAEQAVIEAANIAVQDLHRE